MKGNSEAVERTGKRIPCPVCGGNKLEELVGSPQARGVQFTYVDTDPCIACDGVGEVCVCPVCEGGHYLGCVFCEDNGWVSISKWNETVDRGHNRIMEQHRAEQEVVEAEKPADPIAKLVIVHRHAMAAVMQEWARVCEGSGQVDAGAYGSILGGMTVEYLKRMEEEMGIERHQVFARFVNGMLAYMGSRGDTKGIGIVAGQSGECYSSARQGAEIEGDKEKMH